MMLTRDTCSVSYVTVFKIASIHTAFFLVFLSKASILNRFISNSQNFRKFSALKSESRYVLHAHQCPHVYPSEVHTVLPCSMCPGITCGWRGLAPVTPWRLECQHVSWLLDLRAPAPAGLPPRHITLLAGECSNSISRISSRHSPPLQQSAAESCSSSDCQACLGSCSGCDQCGLCALCFGQTL